VGGDSQGRKKGKASEERLRADVKKSQTDAEGSTENCWIVPRCRGGSRGFLGTNGGASKEVLY